MHSKFAYLIISTLLLLSCEDVLELNPLDPDNNPDYVAPETVITFDDLDGSVLDTSAVTITFSGNDLVIEYAYSLNGDDFSSWSKNTFVTLSYLDEGAYTFSVKGRYSSGEEDETPATISFTVDAVTGPALMFYPRQHIANTNYPVTFQLMAEEVDNLMLAAISVSFDDSLIEIQTVSEGSIFTGSGTTAFHYELTAGSLIIYAMLLGGDSPSVSGTGVLAEITVKSLGTTTLSLDGTQVFKTHEDIPISIQETVNGLVVVE